MFWWKPGMLIPDLYLYSIKIPTDINQNTVIKLQQNHIYFFIIFKKFYNNCFFIYIYIYIYNNIKSGWAGPNHWAGLSPKPRWVEVGPKMYWADLDPKIYTGPISAQRCTGPILAQKNSLLSQTRPRRLGWARTRLAQQQNGRGELISPRPCMQNAIRSACREGNKETPE